MRTELADPILQSHNDVSSLFPYQGGGQKHSGQSLPLLLSFLETKHI
jgi:hypothetical protein